MTKFFIFWPATVPLYGAKAMSTVHFTADYTKGGGPYRTCAYTTADRGHPKDIHSPYGPAGQGGPWRLTS